MRTYLLATVCQFVAVMLQKNAKHGKRTRVLKAEIKKKGKRRRGKATCKHVVKPSAAREQCRTP